MRGGLGSGRDVRVALQPAVEELSRETGDADAVRREEQLRRDLVERERLPGEVVVHAPLALHADIDVGPLRCPGRRLAVDQNGWRGPFEPVGRHLPQPLGLN